MSQLPQFPMDVKAIAAILPHRYPFLLVDRVLSCEPGKKIVAVKCVTVNEPFFDGHFPGNPVMPGVLILEALAQASGLLARFSMDDDTTHMLPFLMGIDGARFRRPVVPGDRVELHAEVLKRKGNVWRTKGVAVVDGVTASEAEFMAMILDGRKQG